MPILAVKNLSVRDAADAAARDLLTVKHWGDSSYLNLPLIYPSGSFVTVKLDRVPDGFRVSDGGFAYREVESFGAQRSFGRTASTVAEEDGLTVSKRTIFVDVPPEQLSGAICDVAKASWLVADKIIGALSEETDSELEDYLRERLPKVFGDHVKSAQKLTGASTSEWEVSAIVQFADHRAVFQAVSNHLNSVSRTGTAFRDLASLDHPPKLIAVVRNKAQLGPKLTLLSQAEAKVIEESQPDDVFVRAAA